MDGSTVFAKTAKGLEEVDTRKHKLNIRLRTILILVNGTDPVSGLTQKFHDVEQLTALLAELQAGGFIREAREHQPYAPS